MTIVEVISLVLSMASISVTVYLYFLGNSLAKRQSIMMERQSEMMEKLNNLSSATAETQLREKITVMKQRIKKFGHKPRNSDTGKYDDDEVVLLIGDCKAGLPLFELSPENTRKAFAETIQEAMDSLHESEFLFEGEKKLNKKKLMDALLEHQRDLLTIDNVEIKKLFDSVVTGCQIVYKKPIKEIKK